MSLTFNKDKDKLHITNTDCHSGICVFMKEVSFISILKLLCFKLVNTFEEWRNNNELV